MLLRDSFTMFIREKGLFCENPEIGCGKSLSVK